MKKIGPIFFKLLINQSLQSDTYLSFNTADLVKVETFFFLTFMVLHMFQAKHVCILCINGQQLFIVLVNKFMRLFPFL